MGISQTHVHRVLNGTRSLSVAKLDLMLSHLNINALDCFSEAELQAAVTIATSKESMINVPVYSSQLGPGCVWLGTRNSEDCLSIPRRVVGSLRQSALARLALDPEMSASLQSHNCVLLAEEPHVLLDGDHLYAIDRGEDAVIRRIRLGTNKLYLLTDGSKDKPLQWEAIPCKGVPPIIGHVIWLGSIRSPMPATASAPVR